MTRYLDPLERLFRKAERMANPAPIRPPRLTPIKTRKHVRVHPTRVCEDCRGPISYFAGRRCEGCYRLQAKRKYEAKVRIRELKMRLAREAGL